MKPFAFVCSPRAALALLLLAAALAGCAAPTLAPAPIEDGLLPTPTIAEGVPTPTALPTRPPYSAGELVDYIAQTGDTLPALAVHFNTTVQEIRAANPIIPGDATTMPPGMPMKIPIYYEPLWGSPYQIIPDNLFVDGPAQVGFEAAAFVREQPGWFKAYRLYAGGQERTGGELIDYMALNYSVSPRLLLAVLEYQTGALTDPNVPPEEIKYHLGYRNPHNAGLYNQLLWAANTLNNGYYGWRLGRLRQFETPDGRIQRPDPWQNAATVALHYYFSRTLSGDAFDRAIHAQGFQATYTRLFGDPWVNVQPHIPASLYQPALKLPFLPGKAWAFTGGPHTNWGEGDPLASLDFAPPAVKSGCADTEEFATAMADGVIARTALATIVLDLDGDGDERTGWNIFYLHLASRDMASSGTVVKAGDPLGHPSCEGGTATGTHVHIARKYNGEWIAADGVLAFDLEGWIASNGASAYQGILRRFSETVYANTASDATTLIQSGVSP